MRNQDEEGARSILLEKGQVKEALGSNRAKVRLLKQPARASLARALAPMTGRISPSSSSLCFSTLPMQAEANMALVQKLATVIAAKEEQLSAAQRGTSTSTSTSTSPLPIWPPPPSFPSAAGEAGPSAPSPPSLPKYPPIPSYSPFPTSASPLSQPYSSSSGSSSSSSSSGMSPLPPPSYGEPLGSGPQAKWQQSLEEARARLQEEV